MTTLKLFTNVLKINSVCLRGCNNIWKQQPLWCLQYSTNVSTTAFIRNTGSSILSNKSHKEASLRQQRFLIPQLQTLICQPPICHQFGTRNGPERANRSDAKSAAIGDADIFGEASKLGLFAKFKLMYKKYWYVLIPVHVVTSVGWMCGFYYLSKSGVDVPSILQYLHLSENIIEKVKGSNLGHWAIAYLCYKVATPVRYALTLGGTTVSIKYLVQQGYIKPIPSKAEFVRMYEEQKAHRAAMKANIDKKEQQRETQGK